MVSLLEREQRLKRIVDPLRTRFDHIFIDCPPSLGLLTLNALVAADAVSFRCTVSTSHSKDSPIWSGRCAAFAAA